MHPFRVSQLFVVVYDATKSTATDPDAFFVMAHSRKWRFALR